MLLCVRTQHSYAKNLHSNDTHTNRMLNTGEYNVHLEGGGNPSSDFFDLEAINETNRFDYDRPNINRVGKSVEHSLI